MTNTYPYKAFISYAHADEAFAASLHERLEKFVTPKQLRTRLGERRLGRFFRDREELASGGSLSSSIIGALADAEYLIVVCSPAAAASRWVNREIEAFLATRDPEFVLLIVPPTAPEGDIAFPQALSRDEELLAADARVFADGDRRAFSKLVAGLLRVPLDTLVQREKSRRRRRALTLAACAALVLIGASAAVYLVRSAASEADARRQQAAAFVGLFVDNLQERIERYEKVGSLDADLVKALDFFATLPAAEMDPTTLEHYRAALLGIGTVRIRQGKPEIALQAFNRALELSRSMVERDGLQASRWYDLAIHTYYIGEAYWEMQRIPAAAERIVESLEYAERAAALAPDEFKYQLEVIYGLNNVGAVSTRQKSYARAVAALERSIAQIEKLRPDYPEHEFELLEQEVEAASWLAEITQQRSDYEAAFIWHDREIALRKKLIESADNPHHLSRLSDALGYYAQSLNAVGDSRRSVAVLQEKVATSEQVVAADPENAFFRERLLIGKAMLANALFEEGDTAQAAAVLDQAQRGMADMIDKDMQAVAAANDLVYVAASRAYFLLRTDPMESYNVSKAAIEDALPRLDLKQINPILLSNYLRCAAVLAAAERMLARPPSALLREALALLEAHGNADSSADLGYRVILLHALGRHDDAQAIAEQLEAAGFRPRFYRYMVRQLATA